MLSMGLYLLQLHGTPRNQSRTTHCASISVILNRNLVPIQKYDDIMLWHFRLGHLSFRYLEKPFPSLFINKDPRLFHCEIRQLAKH